MKSKELNERLQKIGVPSHLYNLDGVGRDDERFCLEFANGEWHVYYLERGNRTTDETFPSEDAACEYIYQELTD